MPLVRPETAASFCAIILPTSIEAPLIMTPWFSACLVAVS